MKFIRRLFKRLSHIWNQSICRQITWAFSILALVTVLGAGFLLYSFQRQFLYEQSTKSAIDLARTLAFSSSSWVLTNDVVGLQEILKGTTDTTDMNFALILSPDGEILAASKPEYIGKVLDDTVSQSLLKQQPEPQILLNLPSLIDVAVPVKTGNRLVGWVRVELSRDTPNANLKELALQVLGMAIVLVMMITVIARWLAGRLTSGLAHLVEVANNAEHGRIFQQEEINGADEIGQLTRHLYRMLNVVDEEKKATSASEQRFRTLLKVVPIPLCYVCNDGVLESFNDRFEQIFGYSREDIPTLSEWWKRAYPDLTYRKRVLEDWHLAVQVATETGGYIQPAEYNVTCKNGDVRIMEISGVKLDDGFLAALVDLTAYRQAERVLRKREEQLQLVLEGAHLGFWDWNIVTNEVDRNAIWAQMLGYTHGEIQHTTQQWADFIHPDDRETAWQSIYDVLEGKTPFHEAEYRMFHKDGSLRWILDHASIVQRDTDGKPTRMSGTHIDITERKQAEKILKDSEARFHAVFNNAAVGLAQISLSGQFLQINQEFCKIIGYSQSEILSQGFTFQQVTFPEDLQTDLDSLNNLLEGVGNSYAHEKRYIRKNGSIVWVNLSVYLQRNDEGEPLYFISAILDISQRKQNEADLAEYREHLEQLVAVRTSALSLAKEAAEAANIAKSTFIATMSHELRTPLNAIMGFSELLSKDNTLTASQKENLAIINRSGTHLLGMINDVLDISKIESGRLELNIQPCDLLKLLQEVGEMMSVRALNSQLSFKLEISPDTPQYIKADGGKLRQVLINLLGNAIKFTKQGELQLRSYVQSVAVDKVSLIIEVTDTGDGIPADRQEDLFKPFVQLARRDSGLEGTGLGLAITKSLIQLMGGQISVSSIQNVGTTFKIALPVSLAQSEEIAIEKDWSSVQSLAPNQPTLQLLIVDDNADNRLLLVRLLTDVGFVVREAENGEEAIAVFEQWQPDLIWMDMRMPVMDGYEATQKIRQLPNGGQVKIIAITASAFKEQHQDIISSGCDAVLHKPFHSQEIFSTLTKYLGVTFVYTETQNHTPASGLKTAAEMLGRLPTELKQRLHKAALNLDIEETETLLVKVRKNSPEIAESLQKMAQSYQFEEIAKLTEPVSN